MKNNINYIYTIWTITPTQVGGNAELNSPIDIPIAREIHTKHPFFPASGLKGSLKRSLINSMIDNVVLKTLFGEEDKIGSLSITDAKLMAFPICSIYGVFGWVSCPLVINQFYQRFDSRRTLNKLESDDQIILMEGSDIKRNGKVILDQIVLIPQDTHEDIESLTRALDPLISDKVNAFLKTKFIKDIGIISDELFTIITKHNTDIQMRTKIDEHTGVVQSGALWSEEYLPENTLLYGFIHLTNNKQKDLFERANTNFNGYFQIGANETIGKGYVLMKITPFNSDLKKKQE
jgi:CRISPR-associated protein Cmr4